MPLAVVVTLFTFSNLENLHVQELHPLVCRALRLRLAPVGSSSLTGLTPIISVASEVKNPQRTIPGGADFIRGAVDDYLRAVAVGISWQYSDRNAGWRLGGDQQAILAAVPGYRHYARYGLAGVYGGVRRDCLPKWYRQYLHERHAARDLWLGESRHLL